jgi:hypothetical protein
MLAPFPKVVRIRAGSRNAYGARCPRDRMRATKHHTVRMKKRKVKMQKSANMPWMIDHCQFTMYKIVIRKWGLPTVVKESNSKEK